MPARRTTCARFVELTAGSIIPWQAIAAILQDDTSAIVTLKSSGLDRPAKLDGKKYASYGARYEGRIVQRMIQNDGGAGDYQEVALPMLGIWETILKVHTMHC